MIPPIPGQQFHSEIGELHSKSFRREYWRWVFVSALISGGYDPMLAGAKANNIINDLERNS